MTDEEMAKDYANEYVPLIAPINDRIYQVTKEDIIKILKDCSIDSYIGGLKAGRPEWHKVADGDLPKGDDSFGKTSIHRKIYLKDRHGNLYTGNYYPKDESHEEDCFAVEFLDWGFQGAQFCAKGQISEWCEIPKYKEE